MQSFAKLKMFVVAFSSAILFSPADGSAQEDTSLKKVLERKILRVAVDSNGYPGWISDKSGKLTGYEHDLIKEIAKQLGPDIVVEPVLGSWTTLLQDVRAGTADIVMNQWFLPATSEIAATDAWSSCYFDSGLTVMYSGKRKTPPSDADLAKGKVYIYPDPSAVKVVKSLGVLKYEQVDTESAYVKAIEKKDVDFILYDYPVAKYLAGKTKGTVKARDGVIKGSEQCYAVMAKSSSKSLVDAISAAIAKIPAESKKAIFKKYGL
jgi:ABC-type amino acid transport substrate-binding protein